MPESFDLAFSKIAVDHEVVTASQASKFAQVQKILAEQSVAKSFAAIAVEGGWIDRTHALSLIDELNTARPNSHPALAVVHSSLPLEAAAQAVLADAGTRDRIEGLRVALETFGYSRSPGELAADLGLVKLKESESPRPGSGTKTTSRVGQTDATKKQATEVRTAGGTSVRSRDSRIADGKSSSGRTKSPFAADSKTSDGRSSSSGRTKSPFHEKSEGRGTSVRTKAPDLPKGGTAVRSKPPAKNASKALILIGAGGGAGLLLIVLVVMAMSSGPKPGPKDSTANNTAVPKESPKPSTPKETAPKEQPKPEQPKDIEAEMKKEAAAQREKSAAELFSSAQIAYNEDKFKDCAEKLRELKRMFADSEFAKNNGPKIDFLLTDADKRTPTEVADPPKPEDPPTSGKDLARLKADWMRAKSEKLVAAQKRIADAKKALEADRTAETTRLASMLKRVAGAKLPLNLKSGLRLNNCVITAMVRDSVKLQFESEGAQVEMDIPWEALDDKSYISLQKALHTADGAAGWYEVGRQCLTRKMWKDAKAAFEECRKLDASFADRIPNLDPILNNEGAFKGASKRIGKDTLVLTYDWSEEDQVQDFKPGSEWKVGGGTAVITTRGQALSSLKEVSFENEISIDTQVVIDEKSSFIIGCFYNGLDQKGYFLHLSARGAEMYRWDGSRAAAPAHKKDGKVTGDLAIRFSVRGGTWKVLANNNEVFSVSDGAHTKGLLFLGGTGSITLKKTTITGKVNPTELDKVFAETEVLIKRAMEGDLRPRKPDEKEPEDDITISIEHEYFLAQLSDSDRSDYERAKQKIVGAVNRGGWRDIRDLVGQNSIFAWIDPIISRNPDFRAAVYWRGVAYLLWGRSEQARKDFLEAAKDPDCYEARAQMAEAWFNELKFEQAKHYVDEALKLAPDHAPAIGLKSFLTFIEGADHKDFVKGNVAGSVKAAMADFDVALKLAPGDADILERQRNLANVIKGPMHLGCKFTTETAHYLVMTDISLAKTKLYAERLEAAYAYYKETFKDFFKEDPKRTKPRIAIFNTREAYMTYGELTLSRRQELTLGYFHPMYKELLLFEDVDMDDTLQTMYHEAFHQFMSMMIPRAPFWYNEGIAEYMGSISVDKGRVVAKARILDGRLKGLKMYLKQALTFEDIMNQTPGQFYSGPVSYKYAQAWSMVHFLYEHENGKYRKLIDTYYKSLLDGKEMREAYDEAFGGTDMKELRKEWMAYVEKMEPAKK